MLKRVVHANDWVFIIVGALHDKISIDIYLVSYGM